MRKVREILRLKWVLGLSHREVAQGLGVSLGSITATVARAKALGLTWEGVAALQDDELEKRLHGPRLSPQPTRSALDYVWMHRELKRAGVTLQLLHLEYLEGHPDGYRYSRFCQLYRAWLKKQSPTMRQAHRAGEKMFVDYAGKKPGWVDRATGEIREAELFVAVLGAGLGIPVSWCYARRSPEAPDAGVGNPHLALCRCPG